MVYFMKALMKEGGGGDHVSVGVQYPKKRKIVPIRAQEVFVGTPGGFTTHSFLSYVAPIFLYK